jgi:hypothetical protein
MKEHQLFGTELEIDIALCCLEACNKYILVWIIYLWGI